MGGRLRLGLMAAAIALLLFLLAWSLRKTREGTAQPSSTAMAAQNGGTRAPESAPRAAPSLSSAEEVPPATPPAAVEVADGVPVRGRVVDARTGEPVPWVDVELKRAKASSAEKTDFDGAFVSRVPIQSGKLAIQVSDQGAKLGALEVDWVAVVNAEPVRIVVDVGPTLFVSEVGGRTPDAGAGYELRIVQSARTVLSAGEIDVHGDELAIAAPPDIAWSTRPLRQEDRQWFVRWPRVEFESTPDAYDRVEVRSSSRLEFGCTPLARSHGQQQLGDVSILRSFTLRGEVNPWPRNRPISARVLIRPARDRTTTRTDLPRDLCELEAAAASCSATLREGESYSVIAWANECEPVVWSRSVRGDSGRPVSLKRLDLQPLLIPAFAETSRALPLDLGPADTHQYVRARVKEAGNWARAEVYEWPGASARAERELVRTRYQVELIGIDRTPLSLGRTWSQILPGELTPPALEVHEIPRLHRFEWTEGASGIPRTDFVVTAGPAGCMVTTAEFGGGASFVLVPKSSVRFTAWHAGAEPIDIRGADFVETDGECVAALKPRPGWGVQIEFLVADSRQARTDPGGVGAKAPGTAVSLTEILALPPLPGVIVESVTGRLGESDEDGLLLVRSRMWPPRLSLRAPGWKLADLRRMDGPGSRWIAFMQHDR